MLFLALCPGFAPGWPCCLQGGHSSPGARVGVTSCICRCLLQLVSLHFSNKQERPPHTPRQAVLEG